MSYIAKTKYGSCDICPATNTNIVKVGKTCYCLSKCYRELKTGQQITKATQRDKQRYEASKNQTHKPSSSLKSSVRGLVDKNIGKDKVIGSKSELLREADRLFADFIKRRDVKNGKYTCPCCNKEWDADKVDSDGNKVLNCGHFCDRDIYSLRFDEDNAAAIDTYCNKKMHYSPDGIEYQNYRKHLVDKFGEEAVAEMELQKRKINKLEISQLKTVIEHYS